MTLVFLRSYSKARNNVLGCASTSSTVANVLALFSRSCSDDNSAHPEFTNSTILIENGYNVHELPVIIRKLKDLESLDNMPTNVSPNNANEPLNYQLVQEEFRKCTDLRDVFSLITKCTKITPNIALGAIERIYDLEKQNNTIKVNDESLHINFAKGAILDKLQKVVLKSKDTQTILNVLKTNSLIMEPFKDKFTDELMLRVVDNKLTLDQLCDFAIFLASNNSDQKYTETIDRLWVGFIEKESDINEDNIVQIFNVLPGLKASKRTLLTLLEQKLSETWSKIKPPAMQEILNCFIREKYFSLQSFSILGHWLYMNIHSLDEDTLLDIVTKYTRLKYSDNNIESAIEKYVKLKGLKISSYILIAGIYNYCLQFQLCNKNILNVCSEYFLVNKNKVPTSFLKCFIYPHGYLFVEPIGGSKYWQEVEDLLLSRFDRVARDDMCTIVTSYIYLGYHPIKLLTKMFHPEYIVKIKNPDTFKKLQLIDTALSLECKEMCGPMLPKDQCYTPIIQDNRIKNLLTKIENTLIQIIGSSEMLTFGISIPNFCSDNTYLIDVMIHPVGLNCNMFNWTMKSNRHDITAILVHLPDHYCCDSERLIGPQMMRIRHMNILGLKVVSLSYSVLSQLYTSRNKPALENYIFDNINKIQCL